MLGVQQYSLLRLFNPSPPYPFMRCFFLGGEGGGKEKKTHRQSQTMPGLPLPSKL